jgi:arylsulfatase A-like enzyme
VNEQSFRKRARTTLVDRSLPASARASGLVMLLALSAAGCGDAGSASAKGMNVLLVTLDTTRADHLSCYGYKTETTPNIDALAADGVRFGRAISTAGITPMSHSSILTGLNNYEHGMRVFYSDEVSHRLKESVETMPEILGAGGWQTAAMVSSYPVSEIYGLDQGFDTFSTGLDLEGHDFSKQQQHETAWLDGQGNATQRRGDYTVDEALRWLDDTGDDPWCLWVHMFDVHDYSVVPPAAFMKPFGLEYDKDASLQDPEWRVRMYDPELSFMDMQVGRLLGWVKEHGQWDDTIVVVTADHGQGLMDGFRRHQWQKHRLLYDWCIHVPLILRIPGEASATVVENQVRTIDILPTLLEALSLPSPRVEGMSMLDLMRGGTEDEPRLAYADALNLVDDHSPHGKLPPDCQDNLFCVTDGRWKMIWHQEKPRRSQLFDLLNDPGETINVAKEHPNRMKRWKEFLDERQAMVFEPPSDDLAAPNDAMLRALGYVGDEEDEEDEENGENEENEENEENGDGKAEDR